MDIFLPRVRKKKSRDIVFKHSSHQLQRAWANTIFIFGITKMMMLFNHFPERKFIFSASLAV